MRILADECCDARLVAALRHDGHDVVFVAEGFARTPDVALLDLAMRDGRLLRTENKDFGRLAFDRGPPVEGVVLVRMSDPDVNAKIERVRAALGGQADDLSGALTVVQAARMRVRRGGG